MKTTSDRGRPETILFDPNAIEYGFMRSELLSTTKDNLYPLLPKILDNIEERDILASWQESLSSKSSPWVVTSTKSKNKKYKRFFTLWKRKEVEVQRENIGFEY